MGKDKVEFDLLEMHDGREDLTLRHCLRAYTVRPRYSGFVDGKNGKADEIHSMLRGIGEDARVRFGSRWKEEWIGRIGFEIKPGTPDDWLLGRCAIPLVALEALSGMGFESEVKSIMSRVTHICSTTQGLVRIPQTLTPEILYLTGVLLSDGHVEKSGRKNTQNHRYAIHLYSGDRCFLDEVIVPLLHEIFDIEVTRFRNYNKAWSIRIMNKGFYRFFTKFMGMPYGKKSIKARIPEVVWGIEPRDSIPFLAGMIDGDIGKHSGGMGGTFRSERFVDDMIRYLARLGIEGKKGRTNILENGYVQNELRIPKSQVLILKEIMKKCYLPKRSKRLDTLFCRGTKAV